MANIAEEVGVGIDNRAIVLSVVDLLLLYYLWCGRKLISRSQMPRPTRWSAAVSLDQIASCHGRLPEVSGGDGVSSRPSVRCVNMRSLSQA